MIQSTCPKGWQGLEEPWRQCQGKFQHQDQEGDPSNRQLVQLWKWNSGLAANQITINMYHRFCKCWVEKSWCHGKVSQQDWPEEKVEQLHKAWTRWSAAQGPEGKTPTQNAICVKLTSLLMLLYLKGVCSPHIQSAVVCIDRFCDFLCGYNIAWTFSLDMVQQFTFTRQLS